MSKYAAGDIIYCVGSNNKEVILNIKGKRYIAYSQFSGEFGGLLSNLDKMVKWDILTSIFRGEI